MKQLYCLYELHTCTPVMARLTRRFCASPALDLSMEDPDSMDFSSARYRSPIATMKMPPTILEVCQPHKPPGGQEAIVLHQGDVFRLHGWEQRKGAHYKTRHNPGRRERSVLLYEVDPVSDGPKGDE